MNSTKKRKTIFVLLIFTSLLMVSCDGEKSDEKIKREEGLWEKSNISNNTMRSTDEVGKMKYEILKELHERIVLKKERIKDILDSVY